MGDPIPIDDIPTLSEWAMVVTVVLLLGAGNVVFRRRQRMLGARAL